MLSLSDTLDAIVRAEKVVSSNRLKDAEKLTLLQAILAQFALEIPGLPIHVAVARDALSRMIDNEQRDGPGTVGKQAKRGKNRKAEGVEESPEVAAGGAEESPEAPEGETEGVPGQAEDA